MYSTNDNFVCYDFYVFLHSLFGCWCSNCSSRFKNLFQSFVKFEPATTVPGQRLSQRSRVKTGSNACLFLGKKAVLSGFQRFRPASQTGARSLFSIFQKFLKKKYFLHVIEFHYWPRWLSTANCLFRPKSAVFLASPHSLSTGCQLDINWLSTVYQQFHLILFKRKRFFCFSCWCWFTLFQWLFVSK